MYKVVEFTGSDRPVPVGIGPTPESTLQIDSEEAVLKGSLLRGFGGAGREKQHDILISFILIRPTGRAHLTSKAGINENHFILGTTLLHDVVDGFVIEVTI